MNRFAAITALLTPAVYATDLPVAAPQWLPGAVEAARGVIQTWHQDSEGVAEELRFFHSSLPPVGDSAELPESENGDAVIVCDRGLLFDAKTSRLVYVGNVRMRDTRLTLHARDNLYLHLEELSGNSSKKQPNETAKPAPRKAAAADTKPTASTTPAEPEAKAAVPASKPVATAATPQPAPKEAAPQIPLHIETGSAEANVVNNRIILYSPAGAAPIVLTRGQDKLIATPGETAPARVLADAAGNVLIEGTDISIAYTNPENGQSTVRTRGGLAYYHAEQHSLYLSGEIELTHPNGKLNCTDSLCLVLTTEESPTPSGSGFMSQFSGMRLSGISAATAKGNVVAETGGVNGSQPGTVHGAELAYNGITGAYSVTGDDCRLTYGSHNILYANEGVHLLPNGDIELRGTNIHGNYERPAQQKGAAPVRGTFQSAGNIVFRAETGQISTDRGITANDSELDFSCTGPVQLVLERKPNTSGQKQKPGMPNLTIAEYSNIITATAEGHVRGKRLMGGKVVSSLEGEHAVINMEKGSAVLTGGSDTPAIMVHENNRIVATPGDNPPVLDLKENGDIILTGKDISATLQGKDGVTSATGTGSMTLIRAENRIETGSGVTIKAPSAIITTRGPLSAILLPGNDTDSKVFGQHSFNFVGVQSAHTATGGTVRTEKGSMQCTGDIRVTMDPNAAPEHEMAGVEHAVANGNVMLLTKDKNNRMMRASGDHLTINGKTGMKSLTGREVILENEHNRHIVSGKGAAVHVDGKNNVRISGEKHDTQVTKLKEQTTKNKQNNSKPKNK
ncbi:MAG: hypothetical protein IJ498_04435 [Akkermansia sp.]|nr:hypothetical protein [Akkermansia sp.]